MENVGIDEFLAGQDDEDEPVIVQNNPDLAIGDSSADELNVSGDGNTHDNHEIADIYGPQTYQSDGNNLVVGLSSTTSPTTRLLPIAQANFAKTVVVNKEDAIKIGSRVFIYRETLMKVVSNLDIRKQIPTNQGNNWHIYGTVINHDGSKHKKWLVKLDILSCEGVNIIGPLNRTNLHTIGKNQVNYS